MLQISSRRIAPILGSLGALGPLSIDMYLPGLPQIAADLNVGERDVQFSLMACFAGLMLGQLFYGPLSDRIGRKTTIYIGLTLFIAGAIGCTIAGTAGQLAAWRFIQGLGGSIGMVISLAVVRDLYQGRAAVGLIALIMIVQGVAPVVAPLLGAAIIAVAPWRTIFAVLALIAIACMILVVAALPETRMPELRAVSRPLHAIHAYLQLIVSRRFIPYVATTALAMAGFFAYLASSSFIFISIYGLTPAAYSTLFAVNAIGLVIGAQVAPRLLGRFRPESIVRAALAVYAAVAVLLVALELNGGVPLAPFAVLLFIAIASSAFVMPLTSVMALESFGAVSGTAAALMGAVQFGAGTLASLVVSLTANGTALPMLATIAACGLSACLMSFFAFPKVAHLLPGREDAS
ncbi:multidrug effflux MFS transporter [Xanthobacter autotrophicus]|uniref:multidrug effflux MFS transporter n=1 Tax=Xanthobacter autotrophicus TaxID=280 RepID=UPI0024A6D948|nr:multidrug effflux MFS transporter [Xanthobacter autotrophicus]MDI4655330.1 multidrug effflux MFS transporter [Xanthobacter autotrophicus]